MSTAPRLVVTDFDSTILDADSYKYSHYLQLPDGTTDISSYISSRGGVYPMTLFIGINIWIKDVLMKPITQQQIDEAELFMALHGEPFNRAGFQRILDVHGGYFPVSVKAVAEGTLVPTGNVLVTIESTDPELPWVASFVETSALRAVWYPTTVASQSYSIRKLILSYLEKTGDPSLIDFKLHDFGARGVSSKQSAGIGGAAHLSCFKGSDTVTGVLYAMKYYGAAMAGFSIPAAEHSTVTAFGRKGESSAYRKMIQTFGKPGAIYAVVSDGFDIDNAVENIWGGELRQEVIDSGATLVVRPDSGDPVSVVLRCVQKLGAKFGWTENTKGYKVLKYVRVIQGDGINFDSIKAILEALTADGWSTDNIAFGMGGALLQLVNRDTNRFAQKTSAIKCNDVWVDVFKDPITDPGKRSLRGRLRLEVSLDGARFYTLSNDDVAPEPTRDAMQELYRNGVQLVDPTWDSICERVRAQ